MLNNGIEVENAPVYISASISFIIAKLFALGVGDMVCESIISISFCLKTGSVVASLLVESLITSVSWQKRDADKVINNMQNICFILFNYNKVFLNDIISVFY